MLPDEPRDPIPAAEIPQPPFWGVRTERAADFDLKTLFEYINPTALFKNQWQLKTASQEDYLRLVEEKYKPILAALEQDAIAGGWFDPQVVVWVFPMPVEGQRPDCVCTGAGIDAGGFPDGKPVSSMRDAGSRRRAAGGFAGAAALHLPAAGGGAAD